MLLPLPGLQAPDFSKWSLPLPEVGLPMPSGGPPGIGDQTASPWASGQKAPALLMQAPSIPQGTLLVCQLGPSSLLHLSSRQHSYRASPLLLTSSWCSPRASLLCCTSRPCSLPGGQQEGDCWLDLLQMKPLQLLTLPTRTGEGHRLGDGASEADRPVTPDRDEG